MALPVGCLSDTDSWTWFYLKSNSSNFNYIKGSEISNRKKISDGENDSGYDPSGDVKPELSQISKHHNFHMAESLSYDDCDDEDEDEEIGEEEETAEIHHSIETIVEGLLGRTLGDAPVDLMYLSSQEYEKLFSSYHGELINAIKNLSQSLRRALHSVTHQNNITPTAAHAALKTLISVIAADCQELPYFQLSSENEDHFKENITPFNIAIFSSYEGLVASAIINKIIEENQLRHAKLENLSSSIETFDKSIEDEQCPCENVKNVSEDVSHSEVNEESFFISELPLECIQIEEVEEITHEYTDSDDDISHQSCEIPSIDEVEVQRCSSGSEADPYDIRQASWQENWLFKKKKRPSYNNMRQQLLTFYYEPSCMLIPFPYESNEFKELDDSSSELSESRSVGSFEFMSDREINVDDPAELPKIDACTGHNGECELTQPFIGSNLKTTFCEPTQKLHDCQLDLHSTIKGKIVSKYEKLDVQNISCDTVSGHTYGDESHNELSCSLDQITANVSKSVDRSITLLEQIDLQTDDEKKKCIPKTEKGMFDACVAAGDISLIPTYPGTIAEREHKKWLNAVPLENNPYSAENIARRNSNSHRSYFSGQASSFEEFEQELTNLPTKEIKEPLQTKLYCGLKSIDGSRYKRDYYVHSCHNDICHNDHETNKTKPIYSFDFSNCDSYNSIPEEALNSLEEKVYIGAGKIFTSENHVKRLERELKDNCLESVCKNFPPGQLYLTQKVPYTNNIDCIGSDNDYGASLPSVKTLATKFTCQEEQFEDSIQSASDKGESDIKIKKSRPCIKVHSLTARSLSREFRDRAKQNILKPMNRFFIVPTQVSDDTSEQESMCSPIDAPQNDLNHGYTSDESSASTSSLPRSKAPRHISRSILQRASYWQRRVEQGLLSDASVGEDFPGLEASSDL